MPRFYTTALVFQKSLVLLTRDHEMLGVLLSCEIRFVGILLDDEWVHDEGDWVCCVSHRPKY